MQILDCSESFKNHYFFRKTDRIIVFHWTGEGEIDVILNWLLRRFNGKGTIGYNFIIDKNGKIFQLCPLYAWFHNTGKGSAFDCETISIAFQSSGEFPTSKQIKSGFHLLQSMIYPSFNIKKHYCHRQLNPDKPDFPEDYFKQLKDKLKIKV